MVRHLLSMTAVAALSFGFSASAATENILDSFGTSGWSSEYDAATKTITYDGDWTGRGWWLDGADYSAYDQIVVEFEPLAAPLNIVVQYGGAGAGDDNNTVVTAQADATSIKAVFNPDFKSNVTQIYLQSHKAGTVVLKNAYLENGVEVDANLLWEGELNLADWSASGGEFATSSVKAGEVLCYTFSAAGGEGAQVLIKGSDWQNLLGASKITSADAAEGSIYVGVTDQMIESSGGKIFLQGNGGIVVTKIAKTGDTFDPAGVISYGEHAAGALEVFATIPEEAQTLIVKFASAPTWCQACDSSWADMTLEASASEDGLTYSFALTPEAKEKINANKTLILNGDGKVSCVSYSSTSAVGEITVNGAETLVNVYNFAGKLLRSNVKAAGATDGLHPGFYIVGGKKVIVK